MVKNSLAPGLLLAAPRLGDPNFERTVVLLGRHEPEGSLGWVINGKTVGVVRELLRESKVIPASGLPSTASFDQEARVGGPVAPASGWLLYRRMKGVQITGEIDIGPDLAVTGDASAFAKVLGGEAPREFQMLLGYAGWGPGQLENELQSGAWLPAPVDATLVFDTPLDGLWDAAYVRSIGAKPGAFTSTRRGMA